MMLLSISYSPSSSPLRPGPPSPPKDLVYNLKLSTLILEWEAPSDTGGRVDLSYSVGCRRCVAGGCEACGASLGFVPQQSGLTERTVTVVNLLPNANYTFTVEALNGVSELLPSKRFYTQVNVSTSVPGRGMDTHTQTCTCSFLPWAQPFTKPLARGFQHHSGKSQSVAQAHTITHLLQHINTDTQRRLCARTHTYARNHPPTYTHTQTHTQTHSTHTSAILGSFSCENDSLTLGFLHLSLPT